MSFDRVHKEADALFAEAQRAVTGPEQHAVDAKFQEDKARMKPAEYAEFIRRIEADEKAAHAKHPNANLPDVFITKGKEGTGEPNHLVTWLVPPPEKKK